MISLEELEAHYLKNFEKNVKQFAYRTTSYQDAEDIMQDCYERCIRYRNSFRDGEDIEKWIGRIRFNCLKDHRRKERGYSFEEVEEEMLEGTPCQLYPKEVVEHILTYINVEHADKSEVLTLYFKHGYRTIDICSCLGTSYQQTRQTIDRFKEQLRERFE